MMTVKKELEHIERQAGDLLREVGVFQPPVPVSKVADHLGISVKPSVFGDDVSGLLVFDDDAPTIGYNKRHPPVRQRFTVAHEIGHFMLHKSDSDLFIDKKYSSVFYRDDRSSEGKYKRELDANAFAAALLMPREMLEREIKKRDFDLTAEDSLNQLAELFQVSRQAMAYRLANANIFLSAMDHLKDSN